MAEAFSTAGSLCVLCALSGKKLRITWSEPSDCRQAVIKNDFASLPDRVYPTGSKLQARIKEGQRKITLQDQTSAYAAWRDDTKDDL